MCVCVCVCVSLSLGRRVSCLRVVGLYEYLSSAFRKALAASADSYAEIKNASIFGRVWRKVPESDAWSLMDRFP